MVADRAVLLCLLSPRRHLFLPRDTRTAWTAHARATHPRRKLHGDLVSRKWVAIVDMTVGYGRSFARYDAGARGRAGNY